MQDLIELFRHNTWANSKVFELAARADPQLVKAAAPGTRDTVIGTLAHLASVEYAYLAMLEDRAPQSRQEVQAPNGPVLTSQLFFPGVAQNNRDGIFNSSLLMTISDNGDGTLSGTYNFVVATA